MFSSQFCRLLCHFFPLAHHCSILFSHDTRTHKQIKTNDQTDPLDLFMYANEIARAHAIGRIDIVENRFVGIKSRGVYETPGGTLLRAAHMDLEGICMDREVKRITEGLSNEFARLCYNGFWFAPEMDLIRHSITYSQRDVTGVVSVELYKGNVIVRGRTSPNALYNPDLASMDIEGGGDAFDYNPSDAAGFIRINAVRLKTYAALRAQSQTDEYYYYNNCSSKQHHAHYYVYVNEEISL